MQIKEHQREPLKNDLRLGIVLLAIISLVFGVRLVSLPLSVGMTIVSFMAFLVFVGVYVLQGNPTLLKVMRDFAEKKPAAIWILPTALWLTSALVALLTGKFTFKVALIGLPYCFLPFLLFLPLRRQRPELTWWDALLVLFIWFPIEFGWLPKVNIPPVQSEVEAYHLIGLAIAIFIYFVLRNLPEVGFTFRLKDKDWRTAIQSFVIFMPIALLIGMPTGFIAVSRHLPSLSMMIASIVGIAFFIAIPEEILFRGIVHNLIEKKLATKKNGLMLALVISSVVFGLAHGNNHNPPFLNIDLGPLGVWHAPWVYILLATLAGFAYGWTFIKTRKVTAAAVVHLLVDWFWSVFFSG